MASLDCYRIHEVGDGVFVYALTTEGAKYSGEPAHWACPKCYAGDKIGVLQRKHEGAWYCCICGTECVSAETGVEPTLV